MTHFVSVKIPEPVLGTARILQERLVRRGLDNLPAGLEQVLAETTCPACRKPMTELVGYSMYGCTCGITKHVFHVGEPAAGDVLRAIGVGALIGLGLYALAQLLGDAEAEKHRRSGAASRLASIRGRSRRGPSTKRLVSEGRP